MDYAGVKAIRLLVQRVPLPPDMAPTKAQTQHLCFASTRDCPAKALPVAPCEKLAIRRHKWEHFRLTHIPMCYIHPPNLLHSDPSIVLSATAVKAPFVTDVTLLAKRVPLPPD